MAREILHFINIENNMELKGKVHYVGVNDRTKALFENLWPLPYGVSYNSYLIADDEMVALIDTVDVAFFEVYLKKIRSVIGDRKIDYLIINHMEPDHSGSISLIKQYYPDIVLVVVARFTPYIHAGLRAQCRPPASWL